MQNDELKVILTEIHQDGGLTPERVVEVARAPTHPLHSRFEWDDAVAGEAHRRSQAADLIRTVKIRYAEDAEGRDREVRAFVSSRTQAAPHQPVYRPTEEVLADPFARQLLLRDARREWLAFKRRYEHLEEFSSIINEVAETG